MADSEATKEAKSQVTKGPCRTRVKRLSNLPLAGDPQKNIAAHPPKPSVQKKTPEDEENKEGERDGDGESGGS